MTLRLRRGARLLATLVATCVLHACSDNTVDPVLANVDCDNPLASLAARSRADVIPLESPAGKLNGMPSVMEMVIPTNPCPPVAPGAIAVLGCAAPLRGPLTGEVAVRGDRAYTSTWSVSTVSNPGNTINVWDVSGDTPLLIDTLKVAGSVARTGDVSLSDDGRLLVAPTEPSGELVIWEVSATARPRVVVKWPVPNAGPSGIHTAKFARIAGTLYVIAQHTDGRNGVVFVDVTTPASPRVAGRIPAADFIHDVYERDGVVFASDWRAGLAIWDVGGVGSGSVTAPRLVDRTPTVGGNTHNSWWFRDPTATGTGRGRYVFVGEEQSGTVGSSSAGDIHVVDLCKPPASREVAFFRVNGAGTHNFWMDESRGILYAAYYNGGLRALDVRGDLGTCTAAQKAPDGRCNLGLMGREIGAALTGGPTYVWGVQVTPDAVYASDMLNGLWKLRPVVRTP